MPKPLPNRKAQVTVMVDADHAHCEVTRRSVTGTLVFVNSTPIRWLLKMQKTVETSTYGSELVAARIATDIALELRYNNRMMGFELDGPVNMFVDNQSVILNTTVPSFQLKKKIHACTYHRIREMICCRTIRFIHCQSIYNAAEVLTKPLGGSLHRSLVNPMLCATVFRCLREISDKTTVSGIEIEKELVSFCEVLREYNRTMDGSWT
jgi:hypothetical protein